MKWLNELKRRWRYRAEIRHVKRLRKMRVVLDRPPHPSCARMDTPQERR